MPSKFNVRPLWGVALALVLALWANGQAAETQAGTSPEQPPTLVFVTKSDECACVLNLCVAGEQEVLNFLARNPWGFRRETVDLKTKPKVAKELGVLAVPVVFLVDGQGRRVARFDGFFAETDLYEAWIAHLNRGKP